MLERLISRVASHQQISEASAEEEEENKERNPRFNFDRRRMGSPPPFPFPLVLVPSFVPRGSAPLFRRLSSCLLRKLPLHGDFEEKLGYGQKEF